MIKNTIYSYNLTDGKPYNLHKLLKDKNIAIVGVDNHFTTRYGGFEKYIDSISDATHIIPYKSKTHYGSLGGVFQNIYEIGKPTIFDDIDTYKKLTGLKPGIDIPHKIWKISVDWFKIKENHGILWNTKLVKEITIPFKDAGINTRVRFGYVNDTNDIYKSL